MSASPASGKKESQWKEYKNSEGRVYWSHGITKQSVWEKPDELRTPFERAVHSKTDWKIYLSKDRPYYVNSITKQTKWDLPPELVALKQKVEQREEYERERERRKEQGLRSPTPPPRSRSPTPEHLRSNDGNALARYDPSNRYSQERGRQSSTPSRPVETVVIPPGGFLTHEKAEAAFIHLLKREGVDENWTWDQTMRKIIMDPLYKALDTLAQKRAAFEKYVTSIIEGRRLAKEARMAKLRPIFYKMFAQNPAIKPYSTVKTASEVFKNDKYWREAEPDEQRVILDDWTTEQRRNAETAERELRNRNIQTLGALIRDLDVSVSTRWRAAHDVILSAPAFRADEDLQQIETIDILGVWDDYSRQLEAEHETESRRLKVEQARKARKAREGFVALLHELKADGTMTRRTKWKEIYPKIREDERYLNLLGMTGSSPLDLWMDMADDLAEESERAAEKVEKGLKGIEKEIKLDTAEEEYNSWIKEAGLESQIEERLRKDVYDLIHGRLVQLAADEARRAERKRRHRIDDLRYALKKVQRHIDLEMTYEEALPHMKDLPEFIDIPEEEDRKAAFEKFIKRQKEKLREEMEEGTSDRRGSTSRMDVDGEDDYRREKDKDRRRDRGDRGDRDDREKEGRNGRDYGSRDKDRSRRRDSGLDYERGEGGRDRERDRDSYRERDKERDGDGGKDGERSSGRKDRRYSVEGEERDYKRARLSSTDSGWDRKLGEGDRTAEKERAGERDRQKDGKGKGEKDEEREAGEVEEGEI